MSIVNVKRKTSTRYFGELGCGEYFMIPDSASDGVLFRRVQSYLAPLEIGGSDAHNAFVVGGLDNDQINPL